MGSEKDLRLCMAPIIQVLQPIFGASLITGFARLGGRSVAIVANQPQHLAGSINVDAADKATQFIQVADAFHMPLIFLTDNPGVLAGSASEKAGILRHADSRDRHYKYQCTQRYRSGPTLYRTATKHHPSSTSGAQRLCKNRNTSR